MQLLERNPNKSMPLVNMINSARKRGFRFASLGISDCCSACNEAAIVCFFRTEPKTSQVQDAQALMGLDEALVMLPDVLAGSPVQFREVEVN